MWLLHTLDAVFTYVSQSIWCVVCFVVEDVFFTGCEKANYLVEKRERSGSNYLWMSRFWWRVASVYKYKDYEQRLFNNYCSALSPIYFFSGFWHWKKADDVTIIVMIIAHSFLFHLSQYYLWGKFSYSGVRRAVMPPFSHLFNTSYRVFPPHPHAESLLLNSFPLEKLSNHKKRGFPLESPLKMPVISSTQPQQYSIDLDLYLQWPSSRSIHATGISIQILVPLGENVFTVHASC